MPDVDEETGLQAIDFGQALGLLGQLRVRLLQFLRAAGDQCLEFALARLHRPISTPPADPAGTPQRQQRRGQVARLAPSACETTARATAIVIGAIALTRPKASRASSAKADSPSGRLV